jgi:hypothetical protein
MLANFLFFVIVFDSISNFFNDAGKFSIFVILFSAISNLSNVPGKFSIFVILLYDIISFFNVGDISFGIILKHTSSKYNVFCHFELQKLFCFILNRTKVLVTLISY